MVSRGSAGVIARSLVATGFTALGVAVAPVAFAQQSPAQAPPPPPPAPPADPPAATALPAPAPSATAPAGGAPVEAPAAAGVAPVETVPAATPYTPEASPGTTFIASSPSPQTSYDPGPTSFSHGLQFVYFNVETGYERVGLRTLHTSNLLPETADSTQSGAFFGVGGGIELVFLTLGPRFRTASFDAWSLWTLDLEAKIHLPLGRVEPYFIFAGGYAKLDGAGSGSSATGPVNIRGFNARAGLGIDVFATKNFTIGASGTAELLALSRSGSDFTVSPQAQAATCNAIADPVQKQQCASNAVYAADGSSLGVAGSLALVAGLHF